jgi:DNA-binding transcriptional MerR regulator
LRSGELARTAGISTDTLRHYERLGLLAPPRRTAGNYRDYSAEAVTRVRIIRNALAMGFSLKELTAIMAIRDQGGAPCHEVRRMAADKADALEQQIRELVRYRSQLRKVIKDWDARLKGTGPGMRARLLEALATPPARPAQGRFR